MLWGTTIGVYSLLKLLVMFCRAALAFRMGWGSFSNFVAISVADIAFVDNVKRPNSWSVFEKLWSTWSKKHAFYATYGSNVVLLHDIGICPFLDESNSLR